MMKHLLPLLLLCWPLLAPAQNAPCSEYKTILKKLEATYQNGKGNLDECLNLVETLRACDPAQAEMAGQWTKNIFDAIKKQKQEAQDATKKAKESEAKAKVSQARADSTATAAQRAARRAYASDLAYKSQIALKNGDLTTAFRLAEFAHTFVDDYNDKVTSALIDAHYYNDNLNNLPHLWNTSTYPIPSPNISKIAFSPNGKYLAIVSIYHTLEVIDLNNKFTQISFKLKNVISVTLSSDGKKIATGSENGVVNIWDFEEGSLLNSLEGHQFIYAFMTS